MLEFGTSLAFNQLQKEKLNGSKEK
jgi:hypothetical protein